MVPSPAKTRVPTTPLSGRVWKKGKMSDGDEDAGMMSGGDGGGKGGNIGKNGGGKDLTMVMVEEQIKEMQKTITEMTKQMDELKRENKRLKEGENHIQNEVNHDKGGWGRGEKGGWKDDDGWVGADWKRWAREDEARKRDGARDDDNGKWEHEFGGNGKYDRGSRVWRGGGDYDRRNEMIARGFDRNTYWKEIKQKVEEVMGVAGITYSRVKVIGEKASFAIIKFEQYESKQEFKKWLSQHGEEVRRERWMWFGDNADKRTRDKEIAVGLVVKALKMAREGRDDVYRDYKHGKVWVGNELVARWDGRSDVMHFRREGKDIRAAYKAMKGREGRDEEEFSE